MYRNSPSRLFGVAILLTVLIYASEVPKIDGNPVKTAVFHSPPFVLRPGSVINKFYKIDLPKGHIALKSFDAEVVDEAGNSVPLHETYLHHWVAGRYYGLIGSESPSMEVDQGLHLPERLPAGNSGICPNTLTQFFGLGSETRQTRTWVPDPYGIEIGNHSEIPTGYEEKWMLNVHAIDTRGVEDRLGCTECRCSLYNVTKAKDYIGGLFCCEDQAQCRLKSGFEDRSRKLYLRYKVKWIDWDESIVPVKIYIFDVTYTGESSKFSRGNFRPYCKVEYEIESCGREGVANDDCIHVKRTKTVLPQGGDVIYAVGHQHTAGVGAALYGEDGRLLCSSIPIYGTGDEAGNESGYVVGMSTCYPTPDSVRIADGEMLTLESNYSSSQMHTGVMGIFYILVAESQPNIMLSRLSD